MSRSLFDKHRFAPVFILSLIVVIAAQIHFSLLHSNFKISVGIICFPVFLCLLDNVSLIPVSVLSGLGVFLARLCFHSYEIGGARNAFTACYPEIFFYISYGILLNFYAGKHKPFYDMPISLLPFFLMDYGANICELVMRSDVPFFSLRIHLWMLVVAVMRSLLVVLCLYLFRQYHQVLVRNEHAERYRKLMLLLSKLSGEIYWMKKNTVHIEEAMNRSYALYNRLREVRVPDASLASDALMTARDIHEIKKEYSLILRGISEALRLNLATESMNLAEVLDILKEPMVQLARENGRRFDLHVSLPEITTEKHYFYMSIFRNLITNAIEAGNRECVKVNVWGKKEDTRLVISVSDNGPGIAPEDLDRVFLPGFSTKINYSTGEISRGLGLGLVRDLVTRHLKGTLKVTSHPGETVFTMSIPDETKDDDKDEILFA